VASLIQSIISFEELSKRDIDLFSIVKQSENPNREKLEALLKKSIEKYTFLSADDFEIMRTKKPVLSHLMV